MTRRHAPPARRPSGSKPPAPRRIAFDLRLAAVLVLALILRLWHIRHGLPDFLEEAIPFRKALDMWRGETGHVDWNPHLFHYPSLTIYLQLLFQKLHYFAGRLTGAYTNPADYFVSFEVDPSPMVIVGRSVEVAADLVTIALTARIADRLWRGAGVVAALLVACAPAMITASRSIFSDTIMTTLAVAAIERMLAYREHGGRARLVAAVVLIGLAAGAKYPAAILLAPLALVLWSRHRVRGIPLWAACAAGALVVFLVTTPYALLDWKTFSRDFAFVGRMASEGQFGNLDRSGFLYHAGNLARDLGWIGVALLVASLVMNAPRALALDAGAIVWVALLAFGIPISLARVEAERYLVPVLPLAAACVAAAVFVIAPRLPAARRGAVLVAACIAIALQPLASGVRTAASGATTTQIEARQWCEAHIPPAAMLVQERYGAALRGRLEAYTFQSSALFAAARPEVQRRYAQQPWHSSVTLPLAVVGHLFNPVQPASGPPVEVEVVPHAGALNTVVYDPRVFAGVDYVLTSDAVRGRFRADPERYAAPLRFYALLDSAAEVVERFTSRGGNTGPEIVIYRLGPRAQAAIAAQGAMDPLWWTAVIPQTYRERAETLMEPGAARDSAMAGSANRILSPYAADGAPAAWVRSLRAVYAARFGGFALAMAMEHREHGRLGLGRQFAGSVLAVDPGDIGACLVFTDCSKRLDAWTDARAALERALAWHASRDGPPPILALEYADALAHAGDAAGARRELEQVAASAEPQLAAEARRRLGGMK